jgi:hypothetical protein
MSATGVSSQIRVTGSEDLAIFTEASNTLWMAELETFTPYAVNTVRLDPNSGNAFKSNGTLTINGHGYGDLISTIYAEIDAPAITTNNGTDAYYVNEFGFAAIKDYSIRVGTQQCEKKHGRWAQAIIEYLYPEGMRWEEGVGKFKKEIQLIQNAKSDNRYFVPLLLSQTRWSHCAIPTVSIHHSTVNYIINLNPLSDCVQNSGNPSAMPYVFGTSSALVDSNLSFYLWTSNIFLDDCERALFLVADLKYITTDTQEVTKDLTSNATITVDQIGFQHPMKYLIWFLRRAEAIDGTTFQRGKIGRKDPFSYAANHGGESMSQPNLLMNSQTSWDVTNTPPLWFRLIKSRESFPNVSKQGPKYLWAFGPGCDGWNVIKTLNLSRVDQIKFIVKNNNTAFTTGIFYLYGENVNVFVVMGGVGGNPFGSSSG